MSEAIEHGEQPYQGEDLSADEFGEHQHGATDKQYIIIAFVLAGMTALEVTLSYADVGWIFLPALIILMIAKFVTVVSFFMHLRFDNKLFSFLFYMGVSLAVFVYIVALATFRFFGS